MGIDRLPADRVPIRHVEIESRRRIELSVGALQLKGMARSAIPRKFMRALVMAGQPTFCVIMVFVLVLHCSFSRRDIVSRAELLLKASLESA